MGSQKNVKIYETVVGVQVIVNKEEKKLTGHTHTSLVIALKQNENYQHAANDKASVKSIGSGTVKKENKQKRTKEIHRESKSKRVWLQWWETSPLSSSTKEEKGGRVWLVFDLLCWDGYVKWTQNNSSIDKIEQKIQNKKNGWQHVDNQRWEQLRYLSLLQDDYPSTKLLYFITIHWFCHWSFIALASHKKFH